MTSINEFSSNLIDESAELVKFIAEKFEDIKSPLNIRQICIQYKKKSGSELSLTCMSRRIERLRQKIHEMKHLDNDEKVKLIFAVSASVDEGYLKKLREDAEVEVDERNRITTYKKKDGGLELHGKHASRMTTAPAERDRNMIEFLAERVKTANSPLPVSVFAREYKEATGAAENSTHLRDRYAFLRNQVAISNDFDMETKVRVLFVTSVPVTKSLLNELRENAVVEVDELDRITKYEANDGSLVLNGRHRRSYTKRSCYFPKREEYDTTEMDSMIMDSGYENRILKRRSSSEDYLKLFAKKAQNEDELSMEVPISVKKEYVQDEMNQSIEDATSSFDEEFIDVRKVLTLLRGMVITLDSPILAEIHKKIDEELRKIVDEKILADCVISTFRTALLALIKSGKSMDEWESSTSLRGFLMMFCCCLVNMDCEYLNDMQKEVKEGVKMLGNGDRSVSMDSVNIVLGTVLLAISS